MESLREATIDDYDDVMAIADIYSGADYLPSKYKDLVKAPNIKFYVSVIDGEIVAFVAGCTVNNGDTLVTRAGRVKEEFKGQGIFGRLIKFVRRQFSDVGGVKFETFTTHTENVEENGDRIRAAYTEIHRKNASCYRYKGEDFKHLSFQIEKIPKRLERNDLAKVFSSESLRRRLFPDDRMIIDWVPYRPLTSNLDYIMTSDMLMLASGPSESTDSDVTYTCLTAGTHYKCKLGVVYSIDVFGDDIAELQNHIRAHLQEIKGLECSEYVEISIFFRSLVFADIDKILSSISMPSAVRKCTEELFVFQKSFI